MKVFLLLLTILSPSLVLGQTEVPDKVYVQSFDPDTDLSSLKDPRFVKKHGLEKERNLMDELPSPEELKVMIQKAGLQDSLSKMDEMDLDILCSHLLKHPKEVVEKKYPHLDQMKLQTLKQYLQESKK